MDKFELTQSIFSGSYGDTFDHTQEPCDCHLCLGEGTYDGYTSCDDIRDSWGEHTVSEYLNQPIPITQRGFSESCQENTYLTSFDDSSDNEQSHQTNLDNKNM